MWNDDFHHSLHVLLTGEQEGYYQDFSGIEDLAKAYREGFVYSGQFSEFRQRRHGNSSAKILSKNLIVFAQNHDQVGNRRMGDRLSQLVSFDKLKLAASVLLLSPFTPLLFMGEEYGDPAPFQYFVSHGDASLIEAVRRGRAEEFERFAWQGEIPDPQSEATFFASKLNWDLQQHGQHLALRNFYKELLRLSPELPSLTAPSGASRGVESFPEQSILAFRSGTAPNRIVAVYHFDSEPTQLKLHMPEGRWEKVLDSLETRWSGPGSDVPEVFSSTGEIELSLKPWVALLFAETPEDS